MHQFVACYHPYEAVVSIVALYRPRTCLRPQCLARREIHRPVSRSWPCIPSSYQASARCPTQVGIPSLTDGRWAMSCTEFVSGRNLCSTHMSSPLWCRAQRCVCVTNGNDGSVCVASGCAREMLIVRTMCVLLCETACCLGA